MVPRTVLVSLVVIALTTSTAPAHPVPRKAYDRTITVRLTRDAVLVDYRLEVDTWTVVFVDLPAISDKVDLETLKKPQQFYEAFIDNYAPIFAENLHAELNGQRLKFVCVKREFQVLDHLRCDFRFEARWQPAPERPHQFTFREGNYELQVGMVRLSLGHDATVVIHDRTEPDEALKARPAIDLRPGDEERLRNLKATFSLTSAALTAPVAVQEEEPLPAGRVGSSLLQLLDSGYGIGVLLLLATGFGAAHALTPGHGKTLVAAYLVGERGTVGHAIVLGLVTTLTHTGIVILIAVALLWFFPDAVPAHVQTVLGLGGGLLIAGAGLWLLLRRLSGGADHIHIGGHGHHHGSGHSHDSHGHTQVSPAPGERVSWGSLILLGMSGGIVPCWDAIAMLGFAIFAQRLWLGVPLLLAFSAGLAGVLVGIGILVVYVKGFADSHWGESWLTRTLPLLSAVVVTLMGLWLCYESLPGF